MCTDFQSTLEHQPSSQACSVSLNCSDGERREGRRRGGKRSRALMTASGREWGRMVMVLMGVMRLVTMDGEGEGLARAEMGVVVEEERGA